MLRTKPNRRGPAHLVLRIAMQRLFVLLDPIVPIISASDDQSETVDPSPARARDATKSVATWRYKSVPENVS